MKKVLYMIASVLQILLLAGSYVFNYFTQKKLGMLRWVVFKNRSWEMAYPIEIMKIVLIVTVAISTIFLLLLIKKKKVLAIDMKISVIMIVVLSLIYIGFTLFLSTDTLKAYYFISLMVGFAAVIQIIKVFMKLVVYKDEK